MTCPFAKASSFFSTTSSGESIILPASNFVLNTQIEIKNIENLFISLANSIPAITSSADSYITSLVSKTLESNFEPTYFQIPFIYSASNNLINGNYKESSITDKDIIITTYEIPYKGEFKDEIAIITTYFNTLTNILFYEIPNEFSYNSLKQAAIAVTKLKDGSFSGKIAIPTTFTSSLFPQIPYRYLPFKISPQVDNDKNLAILEVKASYTTSCQGNPTSACSKISESECTSYYITGNAGDPNADIQCKWNGSYCSDGGQSCSNLQVCTGQNDSGLGGCGFIDYNQCNGSYANGYQCSEGTGSQQENCFNGNQCQEP